MKTGGRGSSLPSSVTRTSRRGSGRGAKRILREVDEGERAGLGEMDDEAGEEPERPRRSCWCWVLWWSGESGRERCMPSGDEGNELGGDTAIDEEDGEVEVVRM